MTVVLKLSLPLAQTSVSFEHQRKVKLNLSVDFCVPKTFLFSQTVLQLTKETQHLLLTSRIIGRLATQ